MLALKTRINKNNQFNMTIHKFRFLGKQNFTLHNLVNNALTNILVSYVYFSIYI